MKHTFEKVGQEWYIVLPEWTGDPGALQMVFGADIMLELLSNHGQQIQLDIDTRKHPDHEFQLNFIQEAMGGAVYMMDMYDGHIPPFMIWLCDVTTFVLGGFPDTIYCKVIKNI